jgi:hypothetical protein
MGSALIKRIKLEQRDVVVGKRGRAKENRKDGRRSCGTWWSTRNFQVRSARSWWVLKISKIDLPTLTASSPFLASFLCMDRIKYSCVALCLLTSKKS